MKVLINNGASVDIMNSDHHTPLYLAVYYGNVTAINGLIASEKSFFIITFRIKKMKKKEKKRKEKKKERKKIKGKLKKHSAGLNPPKKHFCRGIFRSLR